MNRGMTACAVLAGMLTLTGTGTAAARTGERRAADTVPKTIAVATHFEEPALQPDGVDCRPSLLAPATIEQTCKMHLRGVSYLTGTLAGTADLHYQAWAQPPKLRFTGVVPFRGTVEGCGTGTFTMEFHDGVVHYDKLAIDRHGPYFPGSNQWVVRRGSGMGGLDGLVSGGGEVTFRAYPLRGHDGSNEFASGEFDGEVTCASPPGSRRTAATRHGRRGTGTRTAGGTG